MPSSFSRTDIHSRFTRILAGAIPAGEALTVSELIDRDLVEKWPDVEYEQKILVTEFLGRWSLNSTWLVDDIQTTVNFRRRNPQHEWAESIVIENRQMFAAVGNEFFMPSGGDWLRIPSPHVWTVDLDGFQPTDETPSEFRARVMRQIESMIDDHINETAEAARPPVNLGPPPERRIETSDSDVDRSLEMLIRFQLGESRSSVSERFNRTPPLISQLVKNWCGLLGFTKRPILQGGRPKLIG